MPEPVGVQPVVADRLVDQHQVADRVLGGADPAGRLHPDLAAVRLAVIPDRLEHHQGHRQGGGRAHLPGRGLDEVRPGQHRQPGGAAHVVQRDQLAGLQDHLEVGRVPAGLPHRGDLVEDQLVVPGQERAPVDHHVDLVGAGRDRRPHVGQLHLQAGPAAREGRWRRWPRGCRCPSPRPRRPQPGPGRRRPPRPSGRSGRPGRGAWPWRTSRAPCPGCPGPPGWSGRSSRSPGRAPAAWPWS